MTTTTTKQITGEEATRQWFEGVTPLNGSAPGPKLLNGEVK